MRSSGRSGLVALSLLATTATCARADSFLAPNPQVPDAVPYRRGADAHPPQVGAGETIDQDRGDPDSTAEVTAPARRTSGADSDGD